MFNTYKEEIDWGGQTLTLETGKIARQADGAVMATMGQTTVLCTAVGDASADLRRADSIAGGSGRSRGRRDVLPCRLFCTGAHVCTVRHGGRAAY